MDTFRKWWNKPKADDKSILARFYYADKALTAVASELDSFDGRAEPERCSRLVGRLRQGQDQVLAITNIIMDELLGEDRAPRAFRAKFPEEVLQESLAGQLWFGAECLAAGSSIMNREAESSQMRPLAKAVTKSLDHVRNLLREQCLRNKTPNSLTLNLDLNDAVTETLCESLKIFDRLFAEFELLYVSAMVQVKSKQEHEMQELICVLFSETLQRALRIGLLEQEQVDYYDPSLMFSIPRLAIVAGLVIYNKGPLNMSMPADQLSEMFRPFRTLLIKIRDLLRTLNSNELYQLEKLLCTNEDIHIYSPTTDDTKANPNLNPNQIQTQNQNLTQTQTQTQSQMPNVNVNVNTNSMTNDNVSTTAISNFNCDDTDDEEEKFAESNSTSSSASSAKGSARSSSSASISGSESTTSTVSRTSSIQSSSQSSNTMEIPSENNSESDLDRNVINCTVTEIERNFSNRTNNNNNNIINNNVNTNTNINQNDTVNNNSNTMPQNSNNVIASTISNADVWMNAPITFSDETMVAATSTQLLMDSDIEAESSQHRNKNDWINTDCASGYLIPNTNFGNLLQTTDTPLTDSFISSDDEYTQKSEKNFESNGDDISSNNVYVMDTTVMADNSFETINDVDPNLTAIQTMMDNVRMHVNEPNRIQTVTSISGAEGSINRIGIKRSSNNESDSGIGTAENTSLEHTPESEANKLIVSTQSCDVTVTMPNQNIRALSVEQPHDIDLYRNTTSSTEQHYNRNSHCHNYPTSSYFPADRTERHTDMPIEFSSSQMSRPHGKSSRHHSHSHTHSNLHGRREKCERTGCTRKHNSSHNHSNVSRRRSYKRSARDIEERVSISSTSCIYSEGDPQDIWRSSGRIKFKSTENLLHRLFVCIAGVADQLQTNFASDLRQILRSVFLMNISPSLEEPEISIDDKSKDSTSDLFEFRASENDVIQENDGGSNQSIYSAEEANPETDSVFEQSMNQTVISSSPTSNDRQERSASLETEIRITTNRVNVDRRQSLGDEITTHPVSLVVTTTNQIQCMENNGNNCDNQNTMNGTSDSVQQPISRISRNINSNNIINNNNNNNNNINNNNSISNHQIDTQTLSSTTTTTIILTTNNRMNRNSSSDEQSRQSTLQQQQRNTYQNSQQQQDQQSQQHQIMTETPPRWIPDEEAAQCMSCSQTFTTFRRRHHCRCCGGVFCGICSNSQAPLPKFGLNKAVRVCRSCFTLQLSNVGNGTHM